MMQQTLLEYTALYLSPCKIHHEVIFVIKHGQLSMNKQLQINRMFKWVVYVVVVK